MGRLRFRHIFNTNQINKEETKTKMAKPDFRVSTPMEYEKDGKKETAWTNLGVGFKSEKGINVILNGLPVNGKLFLGEYKEFKKE